MHDTFSQLQIVGKYNIHLNIRTSIIEMEEFYL